MEKSVKLSRKIMGGTFGVMAWASHEKDQERIMKIINMGFDQIAALEDKLTDFRTSPFNTINENAGISPVKVDIETFNLIEIAQKISKETDGAFDISYASVGALWRSARQTGIMPEESLLIEQQKLVDYRLILLNQKELTVYLPYKKMRIGLGGIGKGYAVDCLYDFLVKQGIVNFLVDGAGDVRVHCSPEAPRPWRLSIRNPFSIEEKKNIGVVELKEGSIATSGDYVNFVPDQDGKKLHHIIDPLTGYPTNEIISASIIAPTALIADTTATSVIVMNKKKGLEYLNVKKLIGILVIKDGTVLLSDAGLKMMSGKKS
jgi:thiamine biosynthesis lipoprotein